MHHHYFYFKYSIIFYLKKKNTQEINLPYLSTQLHFPVGFYSLCRPDFTSFIIFFWPRKLRLTFLVVQVCWQWIFSAFVLKCLEFVFFFKDIFTRMDILVGRSFFQHFEEEVPVLLACSVSHDKSAVTLIFILWRSSLHHGFSAIWLWWAVVCVYLYSCCFEFIEALGSVGLRVLLSHFVRWFHIISSARLCLFFPGFSFSVLQFG